jgi:WD repeat-containing protein 35
MVDKYITICSTDHVYLWMYKQGVARQSFGDLQQANKKQGREIAFFIDETPNSKALYDKETYEALSK